MLLLLQALRGHGRPPSDREDLLGSALGDRVVPRMLGPRLRSLPVTDRLCPLLRPLLLLGQRRRRRLWQWLLCLPRRRLRPLLVPLLLLLLLLLLSNVLERSLRWESCRSGSSSCRTRSGQRRGTRCGERPLLLLELLAKKAHLGKPRRRQAATAAAPAAPAAAAAAIRHNLGRSSAPVPGPTGPRRLIASAFARRWRRPPRRKPVPPPLSGG